MTNQTSYEMPGSPSFERFKRAIDALASMPENEIRSDQKDAIFRRSDLLFGFRTNLGYDECKEAIKDPSLAACIVSGSMIASFVQCDSYMSDKQKEYCRDIFIQAMEDLSEREDVGETDNAQEIETMALLGKSIDAIEQVAWKLKLEGLL